MRRGLLLSGSLCLFLPAVLEGRQSTTATMTKPLENFLGTWKQLPGPDDPTTLKVEPEGGGIKFSFGCKRDGSCPDIIVGNYDGKLRKDAGNAFWEVSFQKTGDRAMQENGYLNEKLVTTVKWQLSSDGNTLTRTVHNINPPGARDDHKYVYDRSGGPASKDDPFIGFWKNDWNKSDALLYTYTAKGDLFTFISPEGVRAERNCDGKDHPNELDTTFLYSCSFPDDRTYEVVSKAKGKVAGTVTSKVSEDGKKIVRITRNAEGKITSEVTCEKIK
jgi:hypothetical protein